MICTRGKADSALRKIPCRLAFCRAAKATAEPPRLILNVTAMFRPLRQWRSEHLFYRSPVSRAGIRAYRWKHILALSPIWLPSRSSFPSASSRTTLRPRRIASFASRSSAAWSASRSCFALTCLALAHAARRFSFTRRLIPQTAGHVRITTRRLAVLARPALISMTMPLRLTCILA